MGAPPSTHKVCALWRIPASVALSWHAGLLTDYALNVLADPAGDCLYIEDIAGKLAWRDVGRHLQTIRPKQLLFRAVHPLIDRRARAWQSLPGHKDEYGVRYLLTGPHLEAFIAHFHAPPLL